MTRRIYFNRKLHKGGENINPIESLWKDIYVEDPVWYIWLICTPMKTRYRTTPHKRQRLGFNWNRSNLRYRTFEHLRS